jgi:microcin C transport system substrate-binding protein
MKKLFWILCCIWFGISTCYSDNPTTNTTPLPTHGFSVYGQLKYPKDFTHFDYVNPDAPKGGILRLGNQGTFDSLNPYIIKGIAPGLIGLTTATLLDEAYDLAGESYAYGAESIEVADDNSYVIFRLNPNAKFNNGDPITADDVIWVFETLKSKGVPMFRTYYKNVSKVEKLDERAIKFSFNTTTNRELPGILGQLPLLSKKYYETHPFEETSLKTGPSSGPYEVESASPGHSLVIKRVQNWWGDSVPSQKGRHNFEKFKVDYYLEANALFEGFKSGQFDIRHENSAKNWATAYTFPAVEKGFVKREELKHSLSSGTYGFVFNTRRPIFADVRVRKALTLMLNFPWINQHLFYSLYKRNLSYYPNSDFEAKGPPTEEELNILLPFKDQIPADALSQAFTLPTPQDENDIRKLQEQAQDLLKEAGYEVVDSVMTHKESGKALTFEVLIFDKALEKIVLNYTNSLKRLGIIVKVRNLDPAAYELRTNNLDFDMVTLLIPQSASLGNEQRDYFGSERSDTPGTRNLPGIKNAVVDQLIEKLIIAKDRQELNNTAKALDRVLLWDYYMIPAWHSDALFIATWDRFSRPTILPKYHALDITCWWFDNEKDAKLKQESAPTLETHKDKSSIWERTMKWFASFFKKNGE